MTDGGLMKKFLFSFMMIFVFPVFLLPSTSSVIGWRGIKNMKKATLKNVSVNYKGYVSLAPDIDTIFQSTELFLWDGVMDKDRNLFVSSGNEGKVFKVTPTKQVFTIFNSKEGAEIYALTRDKGGNIYIGETPSGIIYRLSGNGKTEEYFKTGEKYIWKMVFDKSGNLFVATGENGRIYKVTGKGKGEIYCETKDSHIVTLMFYRDVLYAGSEPNGLFFEIKKRNKPVVLYDAAENEVHSIDASGDEIFFSTVSRPSTVNPSSYQSFFMSVNAQQGQKTGEKSKLYKFDINNRTVTTLWECTTPPIYSIRKYSNNEILIGTEKGKLYSADLSGRISSLGQFEESSVLNMIDGERQGMVYILTGNLGKVFRLGPELASKGTITSDVFDTGRRSKFGRLYLNARIPEKTSVSLWIRVGNRKDPGDNWIDWKRVKSGEKLNIPYARFFQVRCGLQREGVDRSPIVKNISVSYLPVNRPPLITKIVICPVGIGTDQGLGSFTSVKMPLSEREKAYYKNLGYELPQNIIHLERSKRCIYWKATDPDGDSLKFSLFYRGSNEKEWKKLKEGLRKQGFVFDQTTLPDGTYYIKLSASDAVDNPSSRALSTFLVSEPFIVDNSPPLVKIGSLTIKNGYIIVKATATDSLSHITSVSYSVNAGEWKVILPRDGIFDSNKEDFNFRIKIKEKGEKTVVIKVTDFSLNTGTAKATVEMR